MKQKSSFGCRSPWHSTYLNFPFTARCIANKSASDFNLSAIYKASLPPFQLLPIGFKLYYFPFFESMTLFFLLLFLLPAPKWKHWVVFKQVSRIVQYNQLPELSDQAVWSRFCSNWHYWIHRSPTKLTIITKIIPSFIYCQFSRLRS